IEVGTKLLSAWDETSDQKDNLLFVAARGERFKKLVEITPKLENTENLAPPPFINSEPKDLVQPPFPSPMLQHTASDAITNNAKPSVALPDSQPTIDTSERTSHQLHP
ncbi:hypothetical protein, partial [Pseudomonas viridiflava]